MRVAVVGHVEWVSFALVERVPRAGEIVNATHTWDEAAGGGAVAAVQLAKLAGECDLFTAFGHDDLGSRSAMELSAQGLAVHAAIREAPTRRAVALIDRGNERTIVTLGERLEPKGSDPLPWDLLAEADVAYVTAGDPEAFEAARQARLLVVTSRALAPLAASGVVADAVVGSARDAAESYDARTLDHPPALIVRTEGLHGGSWNQDDEHRRWRSPVPWADGDDDGRPPAADDYGAGDSFAAALSYALAAGMPLADAIAFSARCGAACASGPGPYSTQLTHADLPR